MSDIVAIGELLIDFTTQSVDEDGYPVMVAHAGGAPANFLAAAKAQGFNTALIAKVGSDTFGKRLVDTLKKVGIETSGIISDEDVFTTLAFVTLDTNGDREFAFARKPGADTMLNFSEICIKIIDDAKVFHFGTLSLTSEPMRSTTIKAVEYAKSKGKLITCDPNLRLPLWKSADEAKRQMMWAIGQADIVKISLEEVEFLFDCGEEDAAEILINDMNISLVFVTLGRNGCYFANKNSRGYVANYEKVITIDTTGAGDIFGGSAIAQILKRKKRPEDLTEQEIFEAVKYACTAASLSTQKYGGIGSVPSEAEVLAVLK